MARTGRKTKEMRHVSFRMPADVYQDYIAVAESRGVDLSALLNWVAVEYRPMLLLRRAENGAGMLRAAVVGLPPGAGVGPDPQQALARVNELIRQLQEVASKLSAQMGSDDERRAG
jgi:hypothetical protein